MLKSRMAQASVVAGALILAMIGPAMAAGGPGDAGAGQGGPAAGAGMGAGMGAGGGSDVGAAARPDNPGGGGGPMDNPGSGSGRPENPGGGGGKPDDPGGGGGKPGGETAGNNLSFPVQWSEAAWLAPLPVFTGLSIAGVVMEGTYSPDDTTPCQGAVQKDPLNSWQADSALATPNAVTTVDWGDNLESKDWKLGTVVRVETGLYDNVLPATMTRYEMCYISGSGTDEVWGLRVTGTPGAYTAVELESTEAMVYTAGARLTIQQIVPGGTYTWDPATHMWTGTGASAPIFNMAAWQRTADGPGSYGAELNVGGKVVYGYVWKTAGLTAGEYRLTFSLDDAEGVFLGTGATLIGATVLPSTEVEVAEEGDGGNTALVAPDNAGNALTYIDVGLLAGGGGL